MNDSEVATTAEKLYTELEAEGVEVLFDDRLDSAGVKFNDADLLGIPLRVVVSQRTLQSQSVEIKQRSEKEAQMVPLEQIVSEVKKLLSVGDKPC
jgi:prolyl-tRNA synthetase